MRPPLRGAVVRGSRQSAPRRVTGGASSACLAVGGARGGPWYCGSACAECSGQGRRMAVTALRVVAEVVLQFADLQFIALLQQTTGMPKHYVV